MRISSLVAIIILTAWPALAQDSVSGISPFAPDVRVRAVYWSGLTREGNGYSFSVGTKLRGEQYYIFADGRRTCETPVASKMGRQIETVWDRMLRQPGVENTEITARGLGFLYLETLIGAQPVRAGTPANTDINAVDRLTPLRDLAFIIQGACLESGDVTMDDLRDRLDALSAALE